jgi:uncharacterized protein (DUF58 family)
VPTLSAYHDPTLDAEALGTALPPLVVAAERVASTVLQGVHGRRRAGQGDAFWQFRPFVPGDAAARVDWRQSAKSDRLFVRETEWEAAQTVLVWRDASASMAGKRERAELLLLALGSLLLRGGERVRLFDSPAAPRRNFAGRSGLSALAHTLSGMGDAGGLPAADPSLPRHGRCVLLSDFYTPPEAVQRAVTALAAVPLQGQLVQIVTPAEEEPALQGRILLQGLEGEAPVLVANAEPVFGAGRPFRQWFANHRAALADIARAAGWGFLAHRTDHPPATALLALYQALGGEG